jgi:hypothetical protein
VIVRVAVIGCVLAAGRWRGDGRAARGRRRRPTGAARSAALWRDAVDRARGGQRGAGAAAGAADAAAGEVEGRAGWRRSISARRCSRWRRRSRRRRQGELVALTERHVIVLGPTAPGLRERRGSRCRPSAGGPAARSGRRAGVDRGGRRRGAVARVVVGARGARYGWRDGALVELAPVAGFPACADRTIELAAGRNYAVVDGAERVGRAVPARDRRRGRPRHRGGGHRRDVDGTATITDRDPLRRRGGPPVRRPPPRSSSGRGRDRARRRRSRRRARGPGHRRRRARRRRRGRGVAR